MEIGLIGILIGFFIPFSKSIMILALLILIYALKNDVDSIKFKACSFIILYLFVSISVSNKVDIPEYIETKGIVIDDDALNINKYVVKISNNSNLMVYAKSDLKIGDIIEFKGKTSVPNSKMNPTDFDYKNYLLSKKIYASVYLDSEELIGVNNLYRLRESFKNHIINTFENLSEKNSQFLISVLLSDSKYIDEADLTVYRNLGITHLLAMSGFHIALIFGGLEMFLKIFKIPKINRRIFSILLTYTYIWLVGLPVAALRAFIMTACQLLAFLSKNKYSAYKSILLSAIIILLINPYNIVSVSFWLSFMAVIGIVMVYKRYKYYFKDSILLESFGISLSVFIMISPITAYFFYEINLLSILSNIILVPIYSFAISLSFLSVFIPFKFIIMPTIELVLNIVGLMEKFIDISFTITTGKPSILWILIYYFIVYCFSNNVRFRNNNMNKFVFYSLVCILFIQGALYVKEFNELRITSIYVGQGDSTHISYKGKNYLIDTGGSKNYRPGKIFLLNYLKGNRITKIDKLFISHFDEDHVDGIFDILPNVKVQRSYIPYAGDNKYVKELLKFSKVSIFTKGNLMNLNEGVILESLNDYDALRDENDNSMVLLLKFGEFKALFTGDSGNFDYNDKVSYLKVAHHGSKNSTKAAFLKNTKPKYATISAGVNNRYGHPHKEVINMLNIIGTKYKVTSQNGQIKLILGNNNIIFNGFLDNQNNNLLLFILLVETIVIILFLELNQKILKENYELSTNL